LGCPGTVYVKSSAFRVQRFGLRFLVSSFWFFFICVICVILDKVLETFKTRLSTDYADYTDRKTQIERTRNHKPKR
jgi:hypothetical protein